MRPAVTLLLVLAAAPAFAQTPREKIQPIPPAGKTTRQPPPEGFYRNINGAYDLLFRPYVSSEIHQVDERRLLEFLEQREAAV